MQLLNGNLLQSALIGEQRLVFKTFKPRVSNSCNVEAVSRKGESRYSPCMNGKSKRYTIARSQESWLALSERKGAIQRSPFRRQSELTGMSIKGASYAECELFFVFAGNQ